MIKLKEQCLPNRISNIEKIHEQKKYRYMSLCFWLIGKGMDWNTYWNWVLWVSGTYVVSFVSKMGITGCCLWSASDRFQATVQHALSWIGSRSKHQNQMGVTQRHNVRKRNVYVIWLIVKNGIFSCFFLNEHIINILKQTP